MIFVLISRRQQPQNYRLSSATILPLPLQKMLLRSLDFTISQDRGGTANLLLSQHVLVSSWSKKTAFGRSLIIILRCGRNRLNKSRRWGSSGVLLWRKKYNDAATYAAQHRSLYERCLVL